MGYFGQVLTKDDIAPEAHLRRYILFARCSDFGDPPVLKWQN